MITTKFFRLPQFHHFHFISDITWTNTNSKSAYRWEHEAAYEDLDGTLTGKRSAKVVPTNPTLDPSVCTDAPEWSSGIAGSICDTPLPFHRYSWNNVRILCLLYMLY